MKFFLALLALIACAAADEEWKIKTFDEMKAIRDACTEEVPLTEQQIGHMKNLEFPNEEAIRKHLLCTSVKLEVFSPQTGYHPDRIAKQFKWDLPEAEVQKQSEDCVSKNPKGDKANDVHVYEVHQCFLDSEVGKKLKDHVTKHKKQV